MGGSRSFREQATRPDGRRRQCREGRKNRDEDYKFLFDNDSRAAENFFPDKRVITLTEAKLSTAASDADIFAGARELGAIIVTANGDDYGKEIKRSIQ
jgi:hypothetical protein